MWFGSTWKQITVVCGTDIVRWCIGSHTPGTAWTEMSHSLICIAALMAKFSPWISLHPNRNRTGTHSKDVRWFLMTMMNRGYLKGGESFGNRQERGRDRWIMPTWCWQSVWDLVNDFKWKVRGENWKRCAWKIAKRKRWKRARTWMI